MAEIANGPVVTCIQGGVARFGYERIEVSGEDGTLVLPGRGDLQAARVGDEHLTQLEVPPEFDDPWRVEADFIRLLQGEGESAGLSFEDGVANIEFLEASYQSLAEGRWVELPLS